MKDPMGYDPMSKVKLPQRVSVSDYHEFDSLQDYLSNTGIKVKEVGFIAPEYIGIIYVGRLKDPANAKLISQIKKAEREDDE